MSFKTLCGLAAVASNVQVNVLKINDNLFQAVIQPDFELAKDYPQLSSPLMVQAPADELDSEVHKALTEFTPALQSAVSNLAELQSNLAASVKEAKDALAKKNDAKKNGAAKVVPPAGTTTTNGATPSALTPVKTGKPQLDSPPDLFDRVEPTLSESQTGAQTPGEEDLEDFQLPDLET